MARELVYPICSPELAAALGSPPVPVDRLGELTLLHVQERHRSRLTWAQWLAEVGAGIASDRGVTMATGQGVALGWHHIVADLVERGVVVRPVAEEVASGRLVYLHAPPG